MIVEGKLHNVPLLLVCTYCMPPVLMTLNFFITVFLNSKFEFTSFNYGGRLQLHLKPKARQILPNSQVPCRVAESIKSFFFFKRSIDLHNKRISLQLDFDLLSTDESAKLLLQTGHRLYEQGEKARLLLAHPFHQSAAPRLIAEIRSATGEIFTDQQEMDNVFKSFYTSLYTSEPKGYH